MIAKTNTVLSIALAAFVALAISAVFVPAGNAHAADGLST